MYSGCYVVDCMPDDVQGMSLVTFVCFRLFIEMLCVQLYITVH